MPSDFPTLIDTSAEQAPVAVHRITATAVIHLSARGRRASLLAGGDGHRTQRRTVEVSPDDSELVRVDHRGEATLTLTPRIVAAANGRLRRVRDVLEYDLVPSGDHLIAAARALAALRHAYDTQRAAALNAAKEAYAAEFMRDDSLRALVHPPPSSQRCACRNGRRLLIFHTTDAGLAAALPVEAHRRFRADLAARARSNQARREQELAAHHAKRIYMTGWIEAHGTEDQRARLSAGRLAVSEMYEAIADRVFAPLQEYPRYIHNAHSDLVALYSREAKDDAARILSTDTKIESGPVVHLSSAQWTTFASMQALLPSALFSVRRYRIYWSQRPRRHDPHLVQVAILVKYRSAPLTLLRSYQFGSSQADLAASLARRNSDV